MKTNFSSTPLLPSLLSFYLTLGVPLLYLAILATIAYTPEIFPSSALPLAHTLSHPYFRLFNLTVASLGMVLWLITYYYLGSSFGVLPQTKKIVVSGPYKYLKHPMYLGIFLTFNGLALTTLSFPGFLSNLIILTPINILRAHFETKKLFTSN